MSEELVPAEEASSPAPTAVPRPAGITFVIVLTWLAAMSSLVGGIWLLLISFDKSRFPDAADDVAVVRSFAFLALILGLLTVMVALALGSGSQFARVLVIIVMAGNLINAVWALIYIRGVTLWPAVAYATLALVIITLLSNRAASDYFRKRA